MKPATRARTIVDDANVTFHHTRERPCRPWFLYEETRGDTLTSRLLRRRSLGRGEFVRATLSPSTREASTRSFDTLWKLRVMDVSSRPRKIRIDADSNSREGFVDIATCPLVGLPVRRLTRP